MKDNIRNSSDQGRRYRSQLVKIVEVNARGVLCQSSGVNGYGNGSYSGGGDMGEED